MLVPLLSFKGIDMYNENDELTFEAIAISNKIEKLKAIRRNYLRAKTGGNMLSDFMPSTRDGFLESLKPIDYELDCLYNDLKNIVESMEAVE